MLPVRELVVSTGIVNAGVALSAVVRADLDDLVLATECRDRREVLVTFSSVSEPALGGVTVTVDSPLPAGEESVAPGAHRGVHVSALASVHQAVLARPARGHQQQHTH